MNRFRFYTSAVLGLSAAACLPLFALFLPQLDLILSSFGQWDDLLHIHEQSTIEPIRLQTNTSNVDSVVVQPHH